MACRPEGFPSFGGPILPIESDRLQGGPRRVLHEMERRRWYRNTVREDDDLQVALQLADRSVVSGEPLDLMMDGAGVRFNQTTPALEMGEQVVLTFTSRLIEDSVQASAVVVNRTELGASRRYGFRFTDYSQLESQLSQEIFRLFNRRGSHRVVPHPDAPVQVTLEGIPNGGATRVNLIDVSATGMALRIPATVESAMVETSDVKFSLLLPGRQDPLKLEGIIRNRRLEELGIHYNVEFTLDPDDARHQQGVINDYVLKRQLEIWLRAKAA